MAESRLANLWADIGELQDTHESGLPFDQLARYRGRFPDFCKDLFGLDLTPQQLEGADAVEHHRQVLIQGGNGVGKDTLTAARALFEVYVLDALVVMSGPSERQVREVMMRREIGRLWRVSAGKLPGQRFEMAIRIPGKEEGGLLAFTANDPEKFVGHHSSLGRVFIALTEAQGISAEIFEAVQRCQPSLVLAVCNTPDPDCPAHAFSESAAWKTLRWSCLDHPNVITGRTVIPGAVTREWVDAMRHEHGEQSRFWTYAVLALWPTDSEEALVLREWVDDAVARFESGAFEEQAKDQPYTLGIDPAGPGKDATVVCVRQGPVVRQFYAWRRAGAPESADRVQMIVSNLLGDAKVQDAAVGTPGIEWVLVDEIGIGHGLKGILGRKLPRLSWWETVGRDIRRRHVQVAGVNVSKAPGDPARFVRRKDELLWRLREELADGTMALPPHERLLEEILASRMRTTPDGKLEAEPKEKLRRRIGRSPDTLESLLMSLSPMVATSQRRARFR